MSRPKGETRLAIEAALEAGERSAVIAARHGVSPHYVVQVRAGMRVASRDYRQSAEAKRLAASDAAAMAALARAGVAYGSVKARPEPRMSSVPDAFRSMTGSPGAMCAG